ncbi:MAG: alpha/beta hydrolase [Sporolactobacillus sp.]|uniref:alpha/beta hydrolase fold domain-containing protein n=1 Tax=Sporolactobacillus sp. STSJ-5 TaxID=2965076 RepID=UPI0021079494|nr:alpha/beta hydrolase [Sporolactobacillus sp. STSJ-5]MCQ2010243.1 alpha/beta hydrolase [Sporolactobacillus sp. STSJ-5]
MEKNKESMRSKLVKALLRIVQIKKDWQLTNDDLKKTIRKKRLAENSNPPKKVYKACTIERKDSDGYCYYVMKPKKGSGQKHIFYLHGGGYVYEIKSMHWVFLSKLVEALQCTITVPIYPLAPEHHYQDVFDLIAPLYVQIDSETESQDLVIMGDSAGGGMSLVLAQQLKDIGLPQPGNIVVLSPTLDMSMSNPEIGAAEQLDPVLAAPSLRQIGKWYAADKDPKDELISPIYGSFEGLGKISLFTGTHDLLNPDARRLKRMLDTQDIRINYYEYPSMIHIWPLFPLPEAKQAIEQIVALLK